MIRLACVALALGLLMLVVGIRAVTAPSDVDVTVPAECDSCSARKKDMARMRDVLHPPPEQGK